MISVIIATRNRAQLLASTLDAVLQLEWPGSPFEIVVVDNGSIDETPAVVAAAAARSALAPIVYLHEAKPGKSRALNTAMAHARGDLLVFTDDDVLPSPGWLGAYARAFADNGVDFAAGRVLPLWEAPAPRWLSPDLYGVLAIADGGTRRQILSKGAADTIMPVGANMALRRRVFDRVGGWNPDLGKLQGTLRTGEDHEIVLKMIAAGFIGVYEPEASVRHRVPPDRLRLAYFQRWFCGNGAIEAGFERQYPTTRRYVLGVPRHLWREIAQEVLATAWALLTWNAARAATGHMRLAWFAGYLRGRWNTRGAGARVEARSAPIPRN